MKFDLLLLQVATLLVPGFIWARIDAKFSQKTRPSDAEFLLRSFLFGITSYAITFLLYSLVGWNFGVIDLAHAASQQIFTLDTAKDVLCATIVGFLCSIFWIYASTYKLLTLALQKIGATKRYGDEDVWDYTFNSPTAAVEYVHFRDFDNKIVYAGWVRAYSETAKLRELTLRDVDIYDFDGNKLFNVPLLYIARKPDNIHIEFPAKEAEEKKR